MCIVAIKEMICNIFATFTDDSYRQKGDDFIYLPKNRRGVLLDIISSKSYTASIRQKRIWQPQLSPSHNRRNIP